MKFRSALAWLFCLMLMAGSLAVAEGDANVGLQRDLVVFFTSDVHCGVDQNFGYAGLQAVVDAARATGDHVMLVDDGDSMQGAPLSLLSQGEANIRLMNELGYDLAIPGNHEFDYGVERFMELTGMANFPYICCNFRKSGEPVFDPYLIKEFDGVKIGFVGATTPRVLNSTISRYFRDGEGHCLYDFMEGNGGRTLCAGIQKAVDDVRAGGAQYVILLAHLGNLADDRPYTCADVIEHTRGIDVVLDGHSHDTGREVMKNLDGQDVLRQACGTKLQCIGWMRLSASDGTVDTGLYTWTDERSATGRPDLNNRMSQRVAEENAYFENLLDQPLGFTPVRLTIVDPVAVNDSGSPVRIVRSAECNLGDFVADALRDGTGADVAMVEGITLRVSFEEGPITLRDVFRMFPFNDRVVKIEVTGQQLLNALEWGAAAAPGENGGFWQVSGLTCEIHTYIKNRCIRDDDGVFIGVEGERRVKNVRVGGQPLDPEKTYTLGGVDYSLLVGNGHICFNGARLLPTDDKSDYEVLATYVMEKLNGDFDGRYANPYGEGRIVAVAQAPAESNPVDDRAY